MKRFFGITGAFLLAVLIGSAVGAGINGKFTTVNATSGYLFNGAAGSSGQALCSDGTYFDTPCSVSPAFTGTSGYQLLPSGLIFEWGDATGLPDDATSGPLTLPFTFPNACFNAVATEDEATTAARPGNPRTVAATCTTSTITLWASGSGASGRWIAVGY